MNKKNQHITASSNYPTDKPIDGLRLKVCGMKYQDNIQHVATR